MKLRFTRRATQSLADISDYFYERSPAAMRSVRADIYAALASVTLFPTVGRLQNVGAVRKLVTRRYGYLVYYVFDQPSDQIVILAIQHPAQQREMDDR